jgi:uncharacterized protein (DUF1800 family)
VDRRQFLRLAGTVAAGAGVAACSPLYREFSNVPGPIPPWPPLPLADFRGLSRLTYGPLPEERRRVLEIGLAGWIEEQLSPEGVPDGGVQWRLRPLDALRVASDSLSSWEAEDVILQLKQGALLRQVYSRRQLLERMVEFWTDHFNITVRKGDGWFLKPVDDREVVRAHALGDFGHLLWSSAHSPAMLVYLDNQANVKESPNENYARELLELHTLGVSGGYSQQDVMELARCLTGWTVKRHFWPGQFHFDPDLHDPAAKQLLGLEIQPDGQREAERVLGHLAGHPATARRVAGKLVRRFVTEIEDRASADLADRAALALQRSAGSITAMLRVVLLDGLARDPALWGPKIKRPVDVVASALRLLDADTDGGRPLQQALGAMGQPPFEWPTPDGPPDDSAFWSTNLLPRWNFAIALARNELEGTGVDPPALLGALAASETPAGVAHSAAAAKLPDAPPVLDSLAELLLGEPLPAAQRDSLLAALDHQITRRSAPDRNAAQLSAPHRWMAAGLLASPGFQWR